MATITAADVQATPDLTGAGMMECKKALTEADGDIDKAVEVLRISVQPKPPKRGAERTASNGLVAQKGNALVELRCETDFRPRTPTSLRWPTPWPLPWTNSGRPPTRSSPR